jgi:hypothetical protein
VLSFQYSYGWLVVCLLVALVYATFLYYKQKDFKQAKLLSFKWSTILFVLRTLAVFIIAALLLSPILKTFFSQTEKPIVIFLNDNSQSLSLKKTDSTILYKGYNTIADKLSENFNIKKYSFGGHLQDELHFDYSQKSTNISAAFEELSMLYNNQNVGAIITTTDGVYNEGSNPLYAYGNWQLPIFTVGLGDTAIFKDIFIKKILHNKIGYLHDQINIKVEIGASQCAGSMASLVIMQIENQVAKPLFTKNLSIVNAAYNGSADILLDANKTGIAHYRVAINPIAGEVTTTNNVQDFYIEIIDSKQKIALVASSPHPDLSAIKNIIEQTNNYDCDIFIGNNINTIKPQSYNLIILHQLPSINFPIANLIKSINDFSLSSIYIVASNTYFSGFNQCQNVVKINSTGQAYNEPVLSINQNFNAFTLDNTLKAGLERFPPLHSPFGDYTLSGTATCLAYQKIGAVITKLPLIAINELAGKKTGVICGEGIWRWRLYDYLQHQNQNISNEIINKLIQNMVAKNNKKMFDAYTTKSIFNENEQVDLEAVLYNKNFEVINEPEVSLSITSSNKAVFNFTFSKSEKAYQLNAGYLPPGNYSFVAKTNFGGSELKTSGSFAISALQLEAAQLVANHALLKQLSAKTNGAFFLPNQMTTIADSIILNTNIKPVIYSSFKSFPILNLKWIFFLLLVLLSFEWFIRKHLGGY